MVPDAARVIYETLTSAPKGARQFLPLHPLLLIPISPEAPKRDYEYGPYPHLRGRQDFANSSRLGACIETTRFHEFSGWSVTIFPHACSLGVEIYRDRK